MSPLESPAFNVPVSETEAMIVVVLRRSSRACFLSCRPRLYLNANEVTGHSWGTRIFAVPPGLNQLGAHVVKDGYGRYCGASVELELEPATVTAVEYVLPTKLTEPGTFLEPGIEPELDSPRRTRFQPPKNLLWIILGFAIVFFGYWLGRSTH